MLDKLYCDNLMLSVDWVTLLQNYGNILPMIVIHQT